MYRRYTINNNNNSIIYNLLHILYTYHHIVVEQTVVVWVHLCTQIYEMYMRRCLLFQPVQLCRRLNLYATIAGLHMCAKNGLSLFRGRSAHERDRLRHRYFA